MSPSLSTLFKTQSNPKTNCLKQLQRTCACFPTGKHLIPTNESSLLKTVKQPDRPILKSRELSVNSWTQSHLPKCFPKYFSRLHKYTIEWLRFKWSRIRIHFGPWFSFGMLFLFNWRKNYFWGICVKQHCKHYCQTWYLLWTLRTILVEKNNLEKSKIECQNCCFCLINYDCDDCDEHYCVILLPQLCVPLPWSGSITGSQSFTPSSS